MSKYSNSVGQQRSPFTWLLENIAFLSMRLKGLAGKEAELENLVTEVENYRKTCLKHSGPDFKSARIFEIGYGARPNRLLILISLGYDAFGIDLDRPILTGSIDELRGVFRKNGWRRFIKTAARSLIFDGHERRALRSVLRRRGSDLNIDFSRFHVGDAAQLPLPPASVDFIYSEDVFEHMSREAIIQLCYYMSVALTPRGLAVIVPSVYSGISGGHLVDWYSHTLMQPLDRKTEPWEHLRKRRVNADCFLNELRLEEYKTIFSRHFEIVEMENVDAGRGTAFLTPDIRKELAEFSEEELLSDHWRFVLKARKQ